MLSILTVSDDREKNGVRVGFEIKTVILYVNLYSECERLPSQLDAVLFDYTVFHLEIAANYIYCWD